MKKMMLMMGLLLMSGALMAQEVTPSVGDVTVNVNTFTGMMALVTVIVTAFATQIDFISKHKWAKVLSAVVIGIAATMACWGLQVSDYLAGLVWWQALIAGVAVGISAAGFYDIVKAIWSVFKPKEEEAITYNGKK